VKLKHLTLRGFKSFADRTRLDFASGVNVVVGPNGSGKSNILDAIAWVMGTQATRSLRTEKMEDVVFAGTATRPALPRAEVQLSFLNDDGASALDLAEITITRRLFRDGTSEYEMNGVPCRLLDIQDLLSDGGIGRNQHVLVGQGQIGDILNARPEDHRSVIEEAAGVMKHRSRRDRAVRRLERTDHDIERLNDILSEKRRALRPLKKQASAAARHDAVRSEVHALRLFLGGEEIRRIRGRLSSAALERESALEARTDADARLAALKGTLDVLRTESGEVGALLSRDTAAAARLETVRERLTKIGSVARERRRSLEERIDGAGERREDLVVEEADLIDAIARTTDDEVAASDETERRETALRGLEDEERSLAEQIKLPAEGVIASLRGDLRALETATERDAAERSRVLARMAVVDARIEDESAELERLNQAILRVDEATAPLQDAYTSVTGERVEAQSAWEQQSEATAERRIVVAGARARVEALEGALDGLVDERAREITENADGVLGALVAALDVPAGIAPAVDAALGVWRAAYLVRTVDDVDATAGAVKGAGTGGVSLVVGSRRVHDASETARTLGLDMLIDRLGPDADRELAAAYLGDCVLVEGWKTGRGVVARHPLVTAVTPEGDVITADGILVSQPDGAGPAALEAARVEVEIAEREVQRATSLLTSSQRAFDAARQRERESLERLEAAEIELAGYTEALAMTERARSASREELERLTVRLAAIDEAELARSQRMDALRERVTEFDGEEATRQAAWETLNDRRAEVARQRDAARRSLEDAAGRRASLAERRRLSEQRLAVVRNELTQLVLIPDSAERLHALGEIEAAAERTSTLVAGHIETLRIRQRDLRERAGSAHTDLEAAEALREHLDTERRTASDALNELEVELAELRVRLEATTEAIRRDADATEEQALIAPEPDVEPGGTLEERLASLEADLRRMGPINPLAASEYEELAADVAQLEGQLADLGDARNDLRAVICALDDKMEVLFHEAFEEIQALYQENFALVFPGGTGRLRLSDPADPMGTGVLVEAQPAGKKVGRLSLLSGGERSLAALAFLFAVFRARPSPFYVLDEVEAALDDANLHRFLRLVDTLRRETQLVIITHQQQTMEAADVLYGVTMEPGESSKVLSKRMSSVSV
jgi:chromosome segregation protein